MPSGNLTSSAFNTETTLAIEDAGDPVLDRDSEPVAPLIPVRINFKSEDAGFANSFGIYDKSTMRAELLAPDLNETAEGALLYAEDLTQEQLDNLGFFLLPNGANKNTDLASLWGEELMVEKVAGVYAVTANGTPLLGSGAPAFFSDAAWNPGGLDHFVEDGTPAGYCLSVEDLRGGGDLDFDDALFLVEAGVPMTGAEVKVTFEGESAGFRNTFGYFVEGTDKAGILFADLDENTLAPGTMETLDLTAEEYKQLEFFLIPDGATKNAGLFADLDAIDLIVEEVGGVLQARDQTTGTVLEGYVNPVYVPEKPGNPDATRHALQIGDVDDYQLRWEDLPGGGDKDYNDTVIRVEVTPCDLPPPVLSITPDAADTLEGTDTSTPFTFTITRTGDLGAASTVTWTAMGLDTDPTADADDFIGDGFPTGTVTFAADESTKTITVDVDADSDVEPDEGFKVALSDATDATIDPGNASAEGVIRNDDEEVPPPVLSIAPDGADKAEGTDTSTPFTFTITRTGDLGATSTVTWTAMGLDTDPTADADDFIGDGFPTGTVTFAADESTKTITVDVNADSDVEPDEGFKVALSDATDATIDPGNASAEGVIRNDDVPPASIGDEVFEDVNGNGVRDGGEAGIAGVTVALIDDTNGNGVIDGGESALATTTTDANGGYQFTGLEAGDYIVDVDAPPDFDLTTPPEPRPVTVTAGETVTNADFGYQRIVPPASIGDFVWNDLDKDGIQDAGEPGFAGVTVALQDASGKTVATTTTDANGLYQFTGLAAGDYRIAFTAPDGFEASPRQQGADPAIDSDGLISDVVSLAPGETDATIDGGFFENPPPPIDVSINNITLLEEGETNDQFTLSLSQAATEDVVVQWTVEDVSATYDDDYTGPPPVSSSGQTTITAGETEARLDPGDYRAVDDDEVEGNETFKVTLTSVSVGGATIADGEGIGTIIDNDIGGEDIIVWQNGLGPTSGVEIGTPTAPSSFVVGTDASIPSGDVWSAGGGTDAWSDPNNWQDSSPPTDVDPAIFTDLGAGGTSLVDENFAIASLHYSAAGAHITDLNDDLNTNADEGSLLQIIGPTTVGIDNIQNMGSLRIQDARVNAPVSELSIGVKNFSTSADSVRGMLTIAGQSVAEITSAAGDVIVGFNRTNLGAASGELNALESAATVNIDVDDFVVGFARGMGTAQGTLRWNQQEAIFANDVLFGWGSNATSILDVPAGGTLRFGTESDRIGNLWLAFNDSGAGGTVVTDLDFTVTNPTFEAMIGGSLIVAEKSPGGGDAEGTLTLGSNSNIDVASAAGDVIVGFNRTNSGAASGELNALESAATVNIDVDDFVVGFARGMGTAQGTLRWNQQEAIFANDVLFGWGSNATSILDVPAGGTLRFGTESDRIGNLWLAFNDSGAGGTVVTDLDFTVTNPTFEAMIGGSLIVAEKSPGGGDAEGTLTLGSNSNIDVASAAGDVIVGFNRTNLGAASGELNALESAATVNIDVDDFVVGFARGMGTAQGTLRWNQQEAIFANDVLFGWGSNATSILDVPAGGTLRFGTESDRIGNLWLAFNDSGAGGTVVTDLDFTVTNPTFEAMIGGSLIVAEKSPGGGDAEGTLTLGSNSNIDVASAAGDVIVGFNRTRLGRRQRRIECLGERGDGQYRCGRLCCRFRPWHGYRPGHAALEPARGDFCQRRALWLGLQRDVDPRRSRRWYAALRHRERPHWQPLAGVQRQWRGGNGGYRPGLHGHQSDLRGDDRRLVDCCREKPRRGRCRGNPDPRQQLQH